MSRKRMSIWSRIGNAIRRGPHLVILGSLLFLSFVPMLMGLLISSKTHYEVYNHFFSLPRAVQWDNYTRATLDMLKPLGNTLFIAAVSVLGGLALASFAAYAFARLHMYGKNALFFILLCLMMMPGVLVQVPNFVLVRNLGLGNTFSGVMLFYIGGGQAFSIFLLRSFFDSQPEELFESARLDGATEMQTMSQIALPLARPILITVGIMNLLGYYSDLIWPLLVLTSKEKATLMMVLQKYAPPSMGQTLPNVAVQTAGYMLACVPLIILFTFGMKYYIQGLTSGAIKG